MSQPTEIPLFNRLSTKLALWVVVLAVALGVILSMLQIYMDYFNVQNEFDATTEQVLKSLRKPATQAAYHLDPVLADEVVQGLINYVPIYQVSLRDERDTVLASDEKAREESRWRWLSALLFEDHRLHVLSLNNEDGQIFGFLHVYVDTHIIATGFIERSATMLLSVLAWNLLLVMVVFILVQKQVNKPLAKMVDYMARIDPANPGKSQLIVLKKHKHDELGRLAESANSLLGAISQKSTEREHLLTQMEIAKQSAESANIAKSQFIAKMSHELRTPLNAVIGYSEILQEEVEDMEPDEIADDLEKVLQAARQLLNMVNDVLDISKIESGQTEFHRVTFDIEEMISELLSVVHTWTPQRSNKLEYTCVENIGTMTSDQDKIKQSLLNLLENACKYTENGVIGLSVKRLVKDGQNYIEFIVSDTGIGIPKERQEAIFSMFDQADNSYTRDYDGMGLGLAISNSYALMLGGHLSVNSEVGKGSTFTLLLPADLEIEKQATNPDIS